MRAPVAAAVYLAAFSQELVAVLPPWEWWSAPLVAVGFALLWALVDRTAASRAWARWLRPAVDDDLLVAQADGASAPGRTRPPGAMS